MEDTDQCIHLKNLTILPSQSIEEALNLLFLGDTNRYYLPYCRWTAWSLLCMIYILIENYKT